MRGLTAAQRGGEMAELIINNIGKLYRPREGEVEVFENASVRIEGGVFSDISERPLTPATDAAKVLDAGGMVAIPGIVDPHTHAVFAGDRTDELLMKLKGLSYLEILSSGGGIAKTLRETRAASREYLKELLRERIGEFMRWGVTTLEVKSGYGMDRDTEVKQLQAALEVETLSDVVTTFLGAHIIPPEYSDKREEYVSFLTDVMIPYVAERGLARFVDVFCDRGVYTLEEAEEILRAGKRHGLLLKIHSDELENLGATRMAAELGATSADHLLLSEEEDLQAMAEHGTVPVLLPGTVFTTFLPHYPDARRMLDAGLPVALATDFNPNCPLQNPFFVAQLAVFKMRMMPEDVLKALTVNAAKAIAEPQRGMVEEGLPADLVLLEVKSFTEALYRLGYDPIRVVVKGGKVVRRWVNGAR